MVIAILFQITGFLLVAYAETKFDALLGVIVTSMSGGIGESTLLAYTSSYDRYFEELENLKNIVSYKS